MVNDLFRQRHTLFNTSVGQRRGVESTTGFIIRNISEDNLKHTALDVFNGFCLFCVCRSEMLNIATRSYIESLCTSNLNIGSRH